MRPEQPGPDSDADTAARVAVATVAGIGEGDEDAPPLIEGLRRLGVVAELAVWDDPAVDWGSFDLVVVRSTWDYASRRDAFVAWADAVAATTRLANPAVVLRWNTDKRYLRDLATAGAAVVPTQWLAPGDDAVIALPDQAEVVVKPAVSAGARDTARYRAGDRGAAEDHARRLLHEGRVVMVQPYLDRVDEVGETALLYLGGRFSHAIAKAPILRRADGPVGGLYADEDISPRAPSPAERAAADRVLAAVPDGLGPLLYARVDLVPGPSGEPLLLELEVTEPSLFLAHGDGAVDRFAAVIADRAWPSAAGEL